MPWLLLVALLPVAYGVASLFSYLKGSAKQAFSPLDSVYYCALFGGAFFMVYAYGRDDSFWHLAFLVKAGLWWFALAMLYAMGAGLKDKKGGIAPAIERILRGSRISHAAEKVAAYQGADYSRNIQFGGVVWPFDKEPQHLLVSGKTGAGKSQAINALLRTVLARGLNESAVIADPAGGYYSRFGRPVDALLNPFDRRSVPWSPFAEIRAEYDCQRIAQAAIPDGHGESRQWHFYAQSLFSAVLLSMHRQGRRSVRELLRLVMSGSVKELAEVLQGTPAAPLAEKGNDKMLSNTRAIASVYLAAWQYLPDDGTFSVREFVKAERGGWLFLTYRDDQMALLRYLVATWLELAIVEGLSLSENPTRRLWFIMDELDSLGKVTSLRGGLTKLRKYGGCCVCGLQTIAQLRDTYGHDEAQTLLSCLSTKLVMAAGDGETAKYFEDDLGVQEVERKEVSKSTSSSREGGPSRSSSESWRREHRATVLASEIASLPDLAGFLKLPGDDIVRVNLPYAKMQEINAPFVE